jgi:hypothetical protein
MISTSILSGLIIGPGIRRAGTSADVVRAVMAADQTGRGAIALVPFSEAQAARIVPLALFPPPSKQTVASGRYPYSWPIAVESVSARGATVAAGLLQYARSGPGTLFIQKHGLAIGTEE